MTTAPSEFSLTLRQMQLHGLQWGESAQRGESTPTLALHGWLDNAASFSRLAPELTGMQVLAPDLPGHGLSSHRTLPGPYNDLDELPLIDALLDDFPTQSATLIGHSRGAVLALLYALACPERVDRLVLLDACAPRPLSRQGALVAVRDAMRDWRKLETRVSRGVSSREQLARPLKRKLSEAVAETLLTRGSEERNHRWHWRADRILYGQQPYRYTLKQIYALLAEMHTPTLVLVASQNPWRDWVLDCAQRLPDSRVVECEGSHHMHLEPDTSSEVSNRVLEFCRETAL